MSMRLLIAIPVYDSMHPLFVKSLCSMLPELLQEGISYDIAIETGSLIYIARHHLTNKAIDGGFTHVLWLDSDVIFDAHNAIQLLYADKSIISGIYVSRRGSHEPTLFSSLDPSKRDTEQHDSIFPVAAAGFGFMLTETKVLKEIRELYGNPFLPLAAYGEDISFCIRADRLGFKIYAHPRVLVGHVGEIEYWPYEKEEL